MLKWLKRFGWPSSEVNVVTAEPRTLTDAERVELSFKQSGKCPDCSGKDFFEGPSGGVCTNWKCANEACGHYFNVCIAWGNVISAERIRQDETCKDHQHI